VAKAGRSKMPKKSSKKPTSKSKKILFQIFAPEAKTVSIAGNFNGWDTNSLPMKRDKKGNWKITVDLLPGKYEYRFWVDGVWCDDPNAEGRVENPFGGQNCLRIVGPPSVEKRNSADEMDRSILRVLSGYDGLTPLELWYELGEDSTVREMATEAEISHRLEALEKKGFVERVTRTGADGESTHVIYREKTSDDVAGENPGGR
jgi:hypothetical protein